MVTPLVLIVHSSLATDPNQDLLGLIIVGFDFVLFTVFFIAVFNRIADAKAAKVWPTLAPAINGTFHKGIGLTRPYIVGSYRGLPVRAYVRVRAKSRWTFNYYFETVATLDTHGHDWALDDTQRRKEEPEWHIKTSDEALKQRLVHAGLLTLIPSWENVAWVSYTGRKGTLRCGYQIYARDALPSPEVFQNQLARLKKLENIARASAHPEQARPRTPS